MVRVMLDYSQQQQKSYIGGFKNKRSGVVYHHAWTQTPRQSKYQVKRRPAFTRDANVYFFA